MEKIFSYIILIVVYFILAHCFIERLMTALWKYGLKERDPQKLTATLGMIDRLFYAFCIAFGIYFFVGIWLGIKMASRLISTNYIDKRVPSDEKFKVEGQRKNLYIIGNAISLVFGCIGGVLGKVFFSANISEFINWWGSLKI